MLFSRSYFKAEYSNISDEELETMATGALRLAAVEGDEKTVASWQDRLRQWSIKSNLRGDH